MESLAGMGAYAFYNSVLLDQSGLMTAAAFLVAAAVLASIGEGDV